MATSYTSNKKIGALDSASTPLAAANEIVLNQNGDIVKAALSDVEAKVFDAKTAKTTVDGTEVVIVRQTDNALRQVPLNNIVKGGPGIGGLITNDMVSDSAAIADSKLATINTAGKVTNTAVQAVSTNTANRIVTRDGSGNFAAGTVTATLSGNATTATALATGRTIALTGDVTGTTGSFNGSANVSAATTIANNAVTTAKILNANVTTAKIANDAVDNTKLRNSAALSVIGRSANSTGDPADIAAGTDGHVLRRSGTGLGFGQVVSAGIATGAVTATELASNAVTTVKILDANVTTAKIADSNVTTAKIADANVTDAKLATGAVTGAAGGGKIAASVITGQTQLTDPLADGDEFLVHDTSASALRRVAYSSVRPITFAAAQASTSGTSVDFTGIPSWAKRITVMLNDVSTNGASPVEIRVGSGSVLSSGYDSRGSYVENANYCYTGSSTSGFKIDKMTDAGERRVVTATLINITGTVWLFSSIGANINGAGQTLLGGGNVTLSGSLDRVRITTVNGTDTFDSGTINIMYE